MTPQEKTPAPTLAVLTSISTGGCGQSFRVFRKNRELVSGGRRQGKDTMGAYSSKKRLLLFTAVFTVLSSSAWGVNRFRIEDGQLALGSTGNVVGVLADLDQDIVGFSVSLNFDPTRLRISEVRPGADLVALEPEFIQGVIDNERGELVHGVILSLNETIVERRIAAGEGVEILQLVVDVVAAGAGSTVLDLENAGGIPGRRNVMTDGAGDSVSPGPQLSDGTLSYQQLDPVIKHVQSNLGGAGNPFLVVGLNFGQPGLRVEVCGSEAEHQLLGDGQTLQIFAPACAVEGFAVMEICNSFGCAIREEGFNYLEIAVGGEFTRGDANGDESVDLSDAVSILNYLFLGVELLTDCQDGLDANDSGIVDLSDALYLLRFLFQGGTAPPVPYPQAGADPTPDELPDCE